MFNRISTISGKEFLHIRRDPRLIAAIFIMPLLQLVLFAYALSFDIRNIDTVVINRDQSPISKRFVSSFTRSGYFTIVANLNRDSQIDKALDTNEAKVAISIPPDFTKELDKGGRPQVQILIDGSEPNTAIVAQGYATAITQSFSNNILIDNLSRHGLSNAGKSAPINISSRVWYNPKLEGIVFILPGLIVVIMANLAVIQTALALVREKDHGTIEQLIVSPLHPIELMLGKVFPFLLITLFDVLLITVVGILGFHVPFRGSFTYFAIGGGLFTLATLSLGLLISAVSSTMESANQLAAFVSMLPAFLLSGFVWPLENMPAPLRFISYLFPFRYFVAIVRNLFLKGTNLSVLWPNFLALLIFSVVTLALSAASFNEKVG